MLLCLSLYLPGIETNFSDSSPLHCQVCPGEFVPQLNQLLDSLSLTSGAHRRVEPVISSPRPASPWGHSHPTHLLGTVRVKFVSCVWSQLITLQIKKQVLKGLRTVTGFRDQLSLSYSK